MFDGPVAEPRAESEKWVRLCPSDIVYLDRDFGSVVVCGTRAGTMFGSIVRQLDGLWYKRESSPVRLTGAEIQALRDSGDYTYGRDMPRC